MPKLWFEIMIFYPQKPGILGEMANSRSGSVAGKIQDEPRIFVVPEIKEDFKDK